MCDHSECEIAFLQTGENFILISPFIFLLFHLPTSLSLSVISGHLKATLFDHHFWTAFPTLRQHNHGMGGHLGQPSTTPDFRSKQTGMGEWDDLAETAVWPAPAPVEIHLHKTENTLLAKQHSDSNVYRRARGGDVSTYLPGEDQCWIYSVR